MLEIQILNNCSFSDFCFNRKNTNADKKISKFIMKTIHMRESNDNEKKQKKTFFFNLCGLIIN